LAKKFGSTKATIHKIISENRIRVRDSDEAIRLANLKYERCNFSANTIEKAHMIGLVEGDITAFRKSKHTVRAITNTTHNSFCNMFNKIFRNYGKVRISPTENKTFENYMWRVSVDLNNSFSFLLPENRRKDICELINSDAKAFLSFLAGYVDAEGALMVKKIRENLQYCLRLSTENLDLLKQIESKLVKLNFRPILYKNFLSGSSRMANKTKISYNKDYFSLELFRKSDIALILKALPLKHPEKIAKKQLILKMIKANLTKWSQAEPLVNQLTTEIKAKTKASIAKAKRLYEAR
jgi:intein-encoded DNA endonuclease-like protein